MATTTTVAPTLQSILNEADPNVLADILRMMQLGTMLNSVEYATGTITAADSIVLPNNGALLVQSVRVAAGTASYVGTYMCGDSGSTPVTAATSGVAGIAKLSADGKTITFPTGTQATSVVVRYIPASLTPMGNAFAVGEG